ncbi:MAG: hypothetical protein U0136_18200 [Bdellovibrionota bacterium]
MKPTLTTQLRIIFFLVALTLGVLVALHSSAALSQAQPLPPGQGQPPPDEEDGPPDHGLAPPDHDQGPPDRGMRRERREMRDELRERFRDGRGFGGPGRPGGPDGPEGDDRQGDGRRPGPRIARYLEAVQNYQTAVQDPHQAVGLAVLGLKDSYRKQGNPEGAVKELEELLGTTKDQKMRNIFLFAIRQIYEEAHNSDKLSEVNKRIIKENLAASAK